jgi:hypothetical protein
VLPRLAAAPAQDVTGHDELKAVTPQGAPA